MNSPFLKISNTEILNLMEIVSIKVLGPAEAFRIGCVAGTVVCHCTDRDMIILTPADGARVMDYVSGISDELPPPRDVMPTEPVEPE